MTLWEGRAMNPDNINDRSVPKEVYDEDALNPVTRSEFKALTEMVFQLTKTVEGMQQLFVKAGEYQGKPRGRLPR